MKRFPIRHTLREKDAKKVLEEFSKRVNIDIKQVFKAGLQMEIARERDMEIFIINGRPSLIKIGENLYPTLLFNDIFPFLAKIVVDSGAVPYICNGADVMAPGVVRVNGEFNEGELVLIIDERYEKPLAIGVALYDSKTLRKLKHGKVIKNVHYVTDRIWKLLKKL